MAESDSSDDEDFVLTSAMEAEAYSEEKGRGGKGGGKKAGMMEDLQERRRKARIQREWEEMQGGG